MEKSLVSEIELRIAVLSDKIKNYQLSVEKAKKMSGWQGPPSVGGIDCSREPSGGAHISFAEGLRIIQARQEQIEELKKERKELRRRKRQIEKIYKNLTGAEAQVYYYRVIQNLTQQDAAEKIGFSTRHIQRIEAGMRGRGII